MDDALRRKAEKLLRQTETLEQEAENPEIVRLLHELRVYQTELQLQTEQLMKTQADLQVSEREYYEYYQLAPVCYFKLDRNGTVLSANQRCHGLIMQVRGRSLEGKSLLNYIDPGYHQVFIDHLQEVFRTAQSLTCELCLRQYGDAPRTWVHLQSRVVEQRAGKVCWMIMAEITDRKKLEANLTASERQLKEAQQIGRIGHWQYSLRDDLTYWSDEMFRLLGYSVDEVTPSLALFEQHVHHEDLSRVQDVMRDAFEHGQGFQVEVRYLRRDGDVCHGSLISMSSQGAAEQQNIRGVFQDITIQQRLHEEMMQLQLEEEKSQLLAHFITNASHEFRTPLAIILSTSELLMRRVDQPDLSPRFNSITHQIKRIETLLDDLLLMTSLDTKKSLETSPIRLTSLVDAVLDNVESDIETKQLQLDVEMPTEPVYLKVNEDLMHTAMRCITKNAIQYSQEGQAVKLCFKHADGTAVIEVQDKGIGMSKEVLERAFQRFFRADTAHVTAGFGLGLSIAQAIIEKHGGTITLDSAPNEGTTVTIKLPQPV